MKSKLVYYCDNARHLICTPYSIENLHKMAEELNINRCFFHVSKIRKHAHYDIPARRISEITEKCNLISSFELLDIIKQNK